MGHGDTAGGTSHLSGVIPTGPTAFRVPRCDTIRETVNRNIGAGGAEGAVYIIEEFGREEIFPRLEICHGIIDQRFVGVIVEELILGYNRFWVRMSGWGRSPFRNKSQLGSSFRNTKVFERVSIEIGVGAPKIGIPCSLIEFPFLDKQGLDIGKGLISAISRVEKIFCSVQDGACHSFRIGLIGCGGICSVGSRDNFVHINNHAFDSKGRSGAVFTMWTPLAHGQDIGK